MVVHLVNAVQRVKADDVGVPVIVNNHVHLSDTGNFVIDLDAVQMFGGKVVPVVKVINCVLIIILTGLRTHIVQSVQQKSAGATGRVKHIPIMFRLHHFYRKFDNGARGKILTKVALEKAVHKLLEGDTLHIEVGFIQVYRLKVRYDCTEDAVIDLD